MNPRKPLHIFLAIALTAPLSATAVAAPGYHAYLDCAVSRANYAYLLRNSNYKDEADIKKVEDEALTYLRISASLAGRDLRGELRAAAEKVQTQEETIMKKNGAEAYIKKSAETEKLCATMVQNNKPALLKAMEKYEADAKEKAAPK